MNSRLGLSVLVAASVLRLGFAGVWGRDYIDLKLPASAREYCHIVQFPKGWKAERFEDPPANPTIDYFTSDYEFRVEGLLGTWFLVGAFTPNRERRVNSTNRYRVSLSDPTVPVRAPGKQDWNSATVVPLSPGSRPSTISACIRQITSSLAVFSTTRAEPTPGPKRRLHPGFRLIRRGWFFKVRR